MSSPNSIGESLWGPNNKNLTEIGLIAEDYWWIYIHVSTISLVEAPSRAAHIIWKVVLWCKYLWNVRGCCAIFAENNVNNESRSVQFLVATPKCDVMT